MHRRRLQFAHLGDSVAECQELLKSGYTRAGNWSLGQACRHLRLTYDASIDGYPTWMSLFAPVRPLMRRLLLPRLLRGDSPAGISTVSIFVPPADLIDTEEVLAYSASIERFQRHDGHLHPHPGFGRLEHSAFEQFHAAHAAHHLGFLTQNRSEEEPVGSGR